jgi:hypothetical protein
MRAIALIASLLFGVFALITFLMYYIGTGLRRYLIVSVGWGVVTIIAGIGLWALW